jgi:hypothetical protein
MCRSTVHVLEMDTASRMKRCMSLDQKSLRLSRKQSNIDTTTSGMKALGGKSGVLRYANLH